LPTQLKRVDKAAGKDAYSSFIEYILLSLLHKVEMGAGQMAQQFRASVALAEDPDSVADTPQDSSQPPVIPSPGALMLSSGLSEFCTHMHSYTDTCKHLIKD